MLSINSDKIPNLNLSMVDIFGNVSIFTNTLKIKKFKYYKNFLKMIFFIFFLKFLFIIYFNFLPFLTDCATKICFKSN